ncbi:MAG: hypothetical protein RLZZ28_751 [Bacteroidota bacterium]
MRELNRLFKKLIHTAAGRKRFVLATIGLSLAVLLILAAVQLQANYDELLHSKTNRDSVANFLVINKELSDRNIGATALSKEEIEDIKNQPFVEKVGLLTPSRFKASIQSSSDRFPFFTDIAFESVGAEFIDVQSSGWDWKETSPYIPIIAPNMFLDFYNFQFSFSQNLPQLTQQVVQMIVFKVNVYTPNGILSFNGRVVGFSDRISSLLVPESFMQWGNRQFGKSQDSKPSRLIIRTRDPGNPALVQYLQAKKLVTDADKTRFSRYRKIVEMVVNLSWISGAILFVFAMMIFTLFIQLTIASCKEEIILLITLGVAPQQLRKFLMRQFFPVTVWIVLLSLILIAVLQWLFASILSARQIYLSALPSLNIVWVALLVLLLIRLSNLAAIRKYIRHRSAKNQPKTS